MGRLGQNHWDIQEKIIGPNIPHVSKQNLGFWRTIDHLMPDGRRPAMKAKEQGGGKK